MTSTDGKAANDVIDANLTASGGETGVKCTPRTGGMIIALEGVANVGKTTQARPLRRWLRQHSGHDVAGYEFPDYTADGAGRIMYEMISGGTYDRCEPHAYALLAAANMYGRLPAMRRDIAAGRMLVVDRYTASNVAYGICIGGGCDKRWVAGLQAEMPPADITIWVDGVPHASDDEVAMEYDGRLQDRVCGVYERMYREAQAAGRGAGRAGRGTQHPAEIWVRVKCGVHDSVSDIHQRITRAIRDKVPDASKKAKVRGTRKASKAVRPSHGIRSSTPS